MVVEYTVKVFVDVVEHVHHLHGGAVVAEGGEAHDVTEVDGHLLKELGLDFARLLQRAHHRAEGGGENQGSGTIWRDVKGSCWLDLKLELG